jgi:hypothetical protein
MAAWGEYNGWECGEYKDPMGNRCTYYTDTSEKTEPTTTTNDCPF